MIQKLFEVQLFNYSPMSLQSLSIAFFFFFFSKISFFSFQALNYLGIQPTVEQQQTLRQQLQKDSKGTVSFGGNHLLITQKNNEMYEYRNDR